jgi:hypothetical protein
VRRPWSRCLPLLALAPALLAPAGVAAARAAPRCNGEIRLCRRPLQRVVFPATHDSMSAAALGWQHPNQPVGIPAQLRAGVRGLLFDTYYAHVEAGGTVVADDLKTPRSRLYLCHVACQLGATPLVGVLRSIKRFLVTHPRNVLVFDNEDHIAPRDLGVALRRSGLARHVYRGPPGPRWPRLETLIERRRQVVLLAEHHAAGLPGDHLAYGGILQETPYTWDDASLITAPGNWRASCRPNRGGRRGSLFLMNHWSPPYSPTPAGSAVVNARRVLVGRATACARRRGRWPNLVAVDMFSSGGLFAAVHRLNTLIGRRAP